MSRSPDHGAVQLRVGDERVVEIGPVAHGGHFVAHSDGRTIFVRHALTGEQARIRITHVNRKMVRADAIEIISSSPDRVPAPCSWAHADGCGGCDFQHVRLPVQLALKTQVLRESLNRFGQLTGSDLDSLGAVVEALPGEADGLHWRTRMRWGVGEDGGLGLRKHRSHELVPVDSCLLAAEGLDRADLALLAAAGDAEVAAARGSDGSLAAAVDGRLVRGPAKVNQSVGDREWRVRPTSFWQVHPALAAALSDEVIAQGQPEPGQAWWDLYSGAGLFAAALAAAVTGIGSVDAVEAYEDSMGEARRALHDLTQVSLHRVDVSHWLAISADKGAPHGIVLDPPRAGAGPAVVAAIGRLAVPVVVYVACDPVALARDAALLGEQGFRPKAVRSFDAFPMTHHLETVMTFIR